MSPTQVAIRDVMTRDVACASAEISVDTLEEFLLAHDLSGVPVVDLDRRLVGYIAMTDIVREHHERGNGVDLADRPPWGFHTEPVPRTVADLMTPIAFELQESCPLTIAIDLMTSRRVHRVPVVSDDGILVGIVTASDIVRFLARSAGGRPPSPEEVARTNEAERLVTLGFLARSLAHQVNNALTPMRLSLGRLTSFELSRRPMSAARLHRIELLQDIREGLERVERVVRELKTFSHVEDTPRRPVELAEVLDSAIALADHEIRHRARLERDYRTVPRVDARAADLRQVFLNLLINAVHALGEGEAHINEIRASTWTDEHGMAVVEITDTGSGIPPDALPRIFEPFFTTQPTGAALGLGLAVTRDLVRALGGEIAVDSVVGRGTSIRIALPACDADEPARSSEDERDRSTARGRRRRILIVDDDRPVAAAIALELGEHDVVVAESGREALEILRTDKAFDVILCDLMMPEVSGMDLYETLRLIDPALQARVVLMTGGAFTRRASTFVSMVEAPVLEKPFEPGQLRALLDTLDRHGAGGAALLSARTPSPSPSERPGKES